MIKKDIKKILVMKKKSKKNNKSFYRNIIFKKYK